MMETIKRCLSLGLPMPAIFSRQRRNLPAQSGATVRASAVAAVPLEVPPSVPESTELVSVSGTVIRDGSRFVLRIPNGTLHALESTGRAWPFEGEDVVVLGLMNQASGLLQIRAIHATEEIQAEAV